MTRFLTRLNPYTNTSNLFLQADDNIYQYHALTQDWRLSAAHTAILGTVEHPSRGFTRITPEEAQDLRDKIDAAPKSGNTQSPYYWLPSTTLPHDPFQETS